MSLWRRTLIYLGLIEEAEEDGYPEHYEAEEPATVAAGERVADSGNVRPLVRPDTGGSHVRPVAPSGARITVVRAVTFEDAQQVGDRYRAGQPVLLDLAGVDPKIARRLLDFVSGTIFALRGRIANAGDKAFLLIPEGVEIVGDERRRLADLGYRGDV